MSLLKVAACENIELSSVICKVKGKVLYPHPHSNLHFENGISTSL